MTNTVEQQWWVIVDVEVLDEYGENACCHETTPLVQIVDGLRFPWTHLISLHLGLHCLVSHSFAIVQLLYSSNIMKASAVTSIALALVMCSLFVSHCHAASLRCKQKLEWAPGYPRVKHFKQYNCKSCSRSKTFSERVAYDYYMTHSLGFRPDSSKVLNNLSRNSILRYKTNERAMTCSTRFVGGLWHCMRFTYHMTTYSGYANIKKWRGPFKCRTKKEWISITGHTRTADKWCELRRHKLC